MTDNINQRSTNLPEYRIHSDRFKFSFNKVVELFGFSKTQVYRLFHGDSIEKEKEYNKLNAVIMDLIDCPADFKNLAFATKIASNRSTLSSKSASSVKSKRSIHKLKPWSDDATDFFMTLLEYMLSYEQLIVVSETSFVIDSNTHRISTSGKKKRNKSPETQEIDPLITIPCMSSISTERVETCEALSSGTSFDQANYLAAFRNILQATSPYPGPKSIVIMQYKALSDKAWEELASLCKHKGVLLIVAPKKGQYVLPSKYINEKVVKKLNNLLNDTPELGYGCSIISTYFSLRDFRRYFSKCGLIFEVAGMRDDIV